jgi:hypothetical protein
MCDVESLIPITDRGAERKLGSILCPVPDAPNAEEARVRIDALSIGGEEGLGLFRGWWVVCRGACTEPSAAVGLSSEEGREEASGEVAGS